MAFINVFMFGICTFLLVCKTFRIHLFTELYSRQCYTARCHEKNCVYIEKTYRDYLDHFTILLGESQPVNIIAEYQGRNFVSWTAMVSLFKSI